MAYAMSEKSIADRFFALDSLRRAKLDRARGCAALTLPELLPPYGWTETEQLEPPYSSVPARGVNALASRMMSALLPLNDMPFFRFGVPSGESLALEAKEYLESLSYQVFKKLTQKNLRETIYQALQQLLVLGDTLIILDDDMTFRTCRLDHYVVRRDYKGDVIEIIFLEHTAYSHDENAQNPVRSVIPGSSMVMKKGYDCLYHRVIWLDEEQEWHQTTELDGKIIAEGTYKISPLIPLRWQSIVGENYGRSHVECNIGDIKSLEAYTASLIEGLAAGSSFWMGVDPSGITALDDIASQPNGAWVAARQQDVFTLSPSATMNPQIQVTSTAVEKMRQEVGRAFLMSGAAIPQGDRVTATAVRMVGEELEQVLGGVFSSIARDLLQPIVRRTFYLMVDNEEVDPRLKKQFEAEEGVLSVDIVTGLQALSRESDRERLMQMGEMVRNLPSNAVQNFRWDAYASALITALGFDPRNWVRSPEEVAMEQGAVAAQETNAALAQTMAQPAAQAMAQAAQPAIEEAINQAPEENAEAAIAVAQQMMGQ
tara:strand:- start:2922 stop:4547 length:1626 start_codon:yes stop_codon:yes gene_type:complete